MGTWGTGLFSDDVASDVRDEYRTLVGDGKDGATATDALLQTWASELSDPDVMPVFWLALADTQWKAGRLEERVKVAALRVIADGSDLSRWDDNPRARAKRAAVLQNLRTQLDLPSPAPKRLQKRFRSTCEWEVGEAVAYRLRSGNVALFRVVGHHSDAGGVSPVCEVLDYTDASVPDTATLKKLRPRSFVAGWSGGGDGTVLIGATRAREIPTERLVRTLVVSGDARPMARPLVVLWRVVDESLKELFGVQ